MLVFWLLVVWPVCNVWYPWCTEVDVWAFADLPLLVLVVNVLTLLLSSRYLAGCRSSIGVVPLLVCMLCVLHLRGVAHDLLLLLLAWGLKCLVLLLGCSCPCWSPPGAYPRSCCWGWSRIGLLCCGCCVPGMRRCCRDVVCLLAEEEVAAGWLWTACQLSAVDPGTKGHLHRQGRNSLLLESCRCWALLSFFQASVVEAHHKGDFATLLVKSVDHRLPCWVSIRCHLSGCRILVVASCRGCCWQRWRVERLLKCRLFWHSSCCWDWLPGVYAMCWTLECWRTLHQCRRLFLCSLLLLSWVSLCCLCHVTPILIWWCWTSAQVFACWCSPQCRPVEIASAQFLVSYHRSSFVYQVPLCCWLLRLHRSMLWCLFLSLF